MRRVPWLLLLLAACSRPSLRLDGDRPTRVDVVIVPGCPTEVDGSLSVCLRPRVLWAVHLYEAGVTDAFITSGAATYNRYVEAEAIAAGMAAGGVPADRIWLEENARHTDENMYNSWIIASHFGWDNLAVASHSGHASGACGFLESWGQPCLMSGIQHEITDEMAADPRYAAVLAVRVPAITDEHWLPVFDWEEQRQASGGPARPSSMLLYTWAPVMRLFGRPWTPPAPPETPLVRYSDRLAARAE
jgi:hypothetical protein